VLHRSGTLGNDTNDGNARLAVSDRWGGVSAGGFGELNLAGHVGDEASAVAANRERLVAALGLTTERVAFMSQVHGRDVAVVDGPVTPEAPVPEVDALVTRTPGVALAVLVADCVPVLLSSPSPGGTVLGVAHAGRRGVLSGVVAATVDAMRDLGARPERTSALVGPGVCGRCYEVPAAMADEIVDLVPEARASSRDGTPALDLPAAVAAQLRAAGVTDVEVDGACTAEDPDLYSYRRDPVTGRFAGLVWTDA
jgi:YfiH family protein